MTRIAIHSVPRSGSTWLGTLFDAHPAILYKYQPLFSYEFKGYLKENSSIDQIKAFYRELSQSRSDFLDQEMAKRDEIVPSFRKNSIKAVAYKEVRYHYILENMLMKDSEIKIIGLIRDPRAVLYSWYNAPKEFDKKRWDFLKEWKDASKKNSYKSENYYGYHKWKEVAQLFHYLALEYPKNFCIVNYIDLLQNTHEVMRDLMNFCELELNKQQIDFIKKSKLSNNGDAYSVYKVKNHDFNWSLGLNTEVCDYIKKDLEFSRLEQYIQ